jgi:hypothetical protein
MRNIISAHTVANEVRLMRTDHKGTIIIVEGPDDKKAFYILLDQKSCRIVIAYGRENAIQAITILENNNIKGVVAIIDSDFAQIVNTFPTSNSIFLTDKHDLESMMIASPAFAKLLVEYANEDRVQTFESQNNCSVAEALAKNAMIIGYLRLLSIRKNLGLKFDGLAFSNFVTRDSLRIDFEGLIREIKNHSHNCPYNTEWFKEEIELLKNGAHNPWHISCGHDMIEMLSFALRRTLAARSANDVDTNRLARSLRIAYEKNHFQQTFLYSSLKSWEEKNKPFKLIA